MSTILVETVPEKVRAGERLTREEGLALLREGELLELGELANAVRGRLNPEPAVTFVIDSNPNYTNVCITDCVFCAFYRKPGHGVPGNLRVAGAGAADPESSPGPERQLRGEVRLSVPVRRRLR